MLELTSAAHTSFAANLAFISFTVGEVVVTMFAYATRDWQKLKWANTAFIGLGIPYLYFMPESPLYTYSKGQYSQLEAILRRIATQNGRKEADWYSCYQELVRTQPIKLAASDQVTFQQRIYRLLSHRSAIIKILITALIGFTTLFVYIKISYGLAMMNVSPYLGILIGAIVEATGYTTSSFLISTKLGRKGSFTILMSLTIVCVLLLPNIVKYSTVATVFVAQFGKYTISGAIGVSWIFVPELFPTAVRSSANGFFVASSRIGAIMAPIVNVSISKEYLPYTFYASSILATVVLVLSLFLPETKDKSMDDEQDYVSKVTEIWKITWFLVFFEYENVHSYAREDNKREKQKERKTSTSRRSFGLLSQGARREKGMVYYIHLSRCRWEREHRMKIQTYKATIWLENKIKTDQDPIHRVFLLYSIKTIGK